MQPSIITDITITNPTIQLSFIDHITIINPTISTHQFCRSESLSTVRMVQ